MKTKNRKGKKSFEKEYQSIMKDTVLPTSPYQNQWTGNGDTFTQFSLYTNHPTTASPHTQV